MDSILKSIKSMIGIELEDSSFNNELIIIANSVFSVIPQLSVLPLFILQDEDDTWALFFNGGNRLVSNEKYKIMRQLHGCQFLWLHHGRQTDKV